MGAAQLAIVIEQGADFQLVVTVVGGPDSLTGYTGAMQIRAMKSDPVTLYEVPGGGFTFDDINRQVVVDIGYQATKAFDWDVASYDVLITSGDEADAYRVCEGKVRVDHSVTRES